MDTLIRRGKWKYIYVGDGRRYLFDLESDQHEQRSLNDVYAARADRLHQEVDESCEGLKPTGLPSSDTMRERTWCYLNFDEIHSQNQTMIKTDSSLSCSRRSAHNETTKRRASVILLRGRIQCKTLD